MSKKITTIFINSVNADKVVSGSTNLSFSIDVPPINITETAVLKVANICHTGSGHADSIFTFKIRGVSVNNSSFISNDGGTPTILATTFNTTRNLYEENEVVLCRQTINKIDIIVDTISSAGVISNGIVNTIYFCLSLKIEEDVYE